jgi:iron complex outermembrane recepter protein
MKKLLVVCAFFFLHNSDLFAQFSLSGKVIEKDSEESLSGASVVLNQTFLAVSTDQNGEFSFSDLPSGTYILKISFVGFENFLDTVELEKNLNLSIPLIPGTQWTDEVIVKATRAGSETPTTYMDVAGEYLEKNNLGQDLPYLLNWTPSVVTTSDAGNGIGYSGMRIRGSDQTRVNVTINGIPYNDAESQGVFWVDIPDIAASTQNIQIQRGVGTSTNGAGAFGGSVNLQTLNLRNEPYGQIEASIGSFNTRKFSAQAGTGLIKNHWIFEGKLSNISSDGYIDRASSDLKSYYGSGSYVGKNTVLKLLAFGGRERTYQSWYGVDSATLVNDRTYNSAGWVSKPDGSTRFFYEDQVDNYAQDNFQLHLSQSLGTGISLNTAVHYTYGRGYFEEYMDVNQGWETSLDFYNLPPVAIGDTVITDTDLIRRKWLDNDFYGITANLDYNVGKSNFVFGLAANRYEGSHFGELIWARYASTSETGYRYYQNESIKDDFTVYAKLNYKLSQRIILFGDLQYRGVKYTRIFSEGPTTVIFPDKFNFFNPKVGGTYHVSEVSDLYITLAVGNKEPNRTDFLDNASGEKPKAETLYDLELGYRRRGINSAYEVVGYYMYYLNQLVLTGELNNVGFPIRENVGKSYRAGIELSAQFNLATKWRWRPNLTLSSNKNLDYVFEDSPGNLKTENTNISFSPQSIAASEFSYLPLKSLEISLLSKYVGRQFLTNTGLERLSLDSYFVNDLRIRYNLYPKGIKELGFTLLVNNILGEEYVSNGYVWFGSPYYFPQAGRNFLLGMRVKF